MKVNYNISSQKNSWKALEFTKRQTVVMMSCRDKSRIHGKWIMDRLLRWNDTTHGDFTGIHMWVWELWATVILYHLNETGSKSSNKNSIKPLNEPLQVPPDDFIYSCNPIYSTVKKLTGMSKVWQNINLSSSVSSLHQTYLFLVFLFLFVYYFQDSSTCFEFVSTNKVQILEK